LGKVGKSWDKLRKDLETTIYVIDAVV